MPDSARTTTGRTGFARLPPWAARTVLLVTGATTLFFTHVSTSRWAINYADKPRRGAGDIALYLAEVQRIAEGENYYEAANHELRSRGYPTRSVFNWRTPLPMWLLGVLPSESARRAVIGIFAALLLALAMHVVAREGGVPRGLLCGLLLIGGLMPCWLEEAYVLPVVWSGVFIALSICAYAMKRPALGVGCGLVALVLRELAGPYCVICFLLAAHQRRWREVLAWTVGLAAYLVFYAWHVHRVLALINPDDRAHTGSWLQMGGTAFVLAIAQMNTFLLLAPQWMTAIFLPLAMLGIAGWNTPTGLRAGLTACAFVILFAFVGHPFNQYWGSLVAPLFCLGASQAPAALRDLLVAASRRQIAIPAAAR